MAMPPVGPVIRAALPEPGAVARQSFGAALRAHARAATAPVAVPPEPARVVLEAVEHARQRLDAVLAAARRGQTFTAQELLAVQADAYRYSQTLEVASRVVEHAAQSVKQAVNTNV
jgi:hypothetical protein